MTSKQVIKQQRQLTTSTVYLAQKRLTNSAVLFVFAKETSLADEELIAQPSEADSDQLRVIIKADLLTTKLEVAEELI